MTKKPTDDELRRASDDLYYEIWMMNQLAEILENGATETHKIKPEAYTNNPIISTRGAVEEKGEHHRRAINNALVESFAIHARSLLDFFYKPAKHDDVVAEHFSSTPNEWTKVKTIDAVQKIKDRVNKEVAHLTYARQTMKSKEWPFKEIADDINEVVDAFIGTVPKNLLGTQWQSLASGEEDLTEGTEKR